MCINLVFFLLKFTEIKTLAMELEVKWFSSVTTKISNTLINEKRLTEQKTLNKLDFFESSRNSLENNNNNQDTEKNININRSNKEKHDFKYSSKNHFMRKMINEICTTNEPDKKEISNSTKKISADPKNPNFLSTPKYSVTQSKKKIEKSNYSVIKKKHEIKPAIKELKSKSRTGLQESLPTLLSKSKLQSKMSLKRNEQCVSSTKIEKRILSSLKLESPEKKKPYISSSNYQQSGTIFNFSSIVLL